MALSQSSNGEAEKSFSFRRRRVFSFDRRMSGYTPFFPQSRSSIKDGVRHAAKETFLLTHLAFVLLRYLGLGLEWIIRLCRLLAFATFLFPAFMQGMWYYFLSPKVLRSIRYGPQARNFLDIYLPSAPISEPAPVLIFVTGGAWIIGYKGWGALFAQAMVDYGVIVVSLDYRNFPQGTIGDMIDDVTTGVGWVFANIETFRGDPLRVHLAGQSAGAHISSLVLLTQAMRHISSRNRHEHAAYEKKHPLPHFRSSPGTEGTDGRQLGEELEEPKLRPSIAGNGVSNFESLDDSLLDAHGSAHEPLLSAQFSSPTRTDSSFAGDALSAVPVTPLSGDFWPDRRDREAAGRQEGGVRSVGEAAGQQVPWQHPKRPRGPHRTLSGNDLDLMGGDAAWDCSMVRSYVGIAGVYNLVAVAPHLEQRGLNRFLVNSIFEGEASLSAYSPEILVRSPAFSAAARALPPVRLHHGTRDVSAPYSLSVNFCEALRSAGADVTLRLYPMKIHVDLSLVDHMRGGVDALVADCIDTMLGQQFRKKHEVSRPRLLPDFLISLGRNVSPF